MFFNRLAGLVNRLPWFVVGGAVVFATVAGIVGVPVAGVLSGGGFTDPASQAATATARLEQATGLTADGGVVVLVSPGQDVSTTAVKSEVEAIAATVARDSAIYSVATFYTTGSPAFVASDRRSTFLVGSFRKGADTAQAAPRIRNSLAGRSDVKVGGSAAVQGDVGKQVGADLGKAEGLAFPILFLVALWVFRGAVAALMPLLVGGLTIVGTFLGLYLINSRVTPMSIFALNLTTGAGLGLAIDYSLFIISRFREEIGRGLATEEAITRTLNTAGRTVLFSSLTVAAAMASLLVFPLKFLYSMGAAGVLVALLASTVALLVLPAVLRLLGPRINALAPRSWQRVETNAADTNRFWYRLSHLVMRRPLPIAFLSAVLLIAVGLPFLGIRFTSVDATALPASFGSRQVSDRLAADFPGGGGSTMTVVVEASRDRSAEVVALQSRLRSLANVDRVSAPMFVDGDTWKLDVHTAKTSFDPAASTLVSDVRAQPAPFTVLVGGTAAEFVDLKASLATHLPLAIGIVAGATVLLLFLMTGSVILPLKAVLMNLLTLSAAFGVLVLVFQDGFGHALLAFNTPGSLESTQPVLLFALVFGLSTDYGVFLLTRIKEARESGLSNSEAVAEGLQRTGRIVTAAALLFCIAIGAFATSNIVFIKELGVGTAAGVLIDATIVRAFLVPSLMGLLGEWNWWAPRPLRWVYESFGIHEGGSGVHQSPTGVSVSGRQSSPARR